MEDELYLYRLLYGQWFNNPIHYVDGYFFRYRKNILSIHTIDEMRELVGASRIAESSETDDFERTVDIINAKYVIPGASIINQRVQRFTDDSKFPELHSLTELRFCLIAELKSGDNINSSIQDYTFSFKLLSEYDIREYNLNESRQTVGLITKYRIPAVQNKNIKKRTFKSPITIPVDLLPSISMIRKESQESQESVSIPINNFNWANATGFGIYSGKNSIFRCLDIDGCDSNEFIDSLLIDLGLGDNYPWVIKTGSGDGFHIWISCNDSINPELMLKGDARKNFERYGAIYYMPKRVYENTFRVIELRWNSFCMLPPSIGPCGLKYKFRNHLPQNSPKIVSLKKIIKIIERIGENSSIKYDDIIHRDLHYGGFSCSEETETMFLCFDTETTGLPKDYNADYSDTDNWPRIVQLSYILFIFQDQRVKVLKKQNFILSPDNSFQIPSSSMKFHGISDIDARKKGFNRKSVLESFAKQLDEIDYIIGHNVDFDINVLRAEFIRENIDDSHQFNHIKKVCTMKSSMPLYPKGSMWPKLENLYFQLIGEEMEGAHNSMNDVVATFKCFKVLVNKDLIEVNKTINYNSLEAPANQW